MSGQQWAVTSLDFSWVLTRRISGQHTRDLFIATDLFIAAVFTLSQGQKPCRWPSTEEGCLSSVSIARRHQDQKQLGEEGFISVSHHGPSSKKVRSGSLGVRKWELRKNAAYWFASHSLSHPASLYTPDHLPRSGYTHSMLAGPSRSNHQSRRTPKTCPQTSLMEGFSQ